MVQSINPNSMHIEREALPNPKWLEWSQRLQALAQSGLTYTTNPFDIDRYQAIRELAVEIMAIYTETDLYVMRGIVDVQTGYITPKVDVRGAVFFNDDILLVKELVDGLWTLPGGWADVNESPSIAVQREVFEETGYNVLAKKIAALYDRNMHGHPPYLFHSYKIFFLCDLIGGQPRTSIETGEALFFPQNKIPDLSLTRTTPEEVERMFYHYRHPDIPTDFD